MISAGRAWRGAYANMLGPRRRPRDSTRAETRREPAARFWTELSASAQPRPQKWRPRSRQRPRRRSVGCSRHRRQRSKTRRPTNGRRHGRTERPCAGQPRAPTFVWLLHSGSVGQHPPPASNAGCPPVENSFDAQRGPHPIAPRGPRSVPPRHTPLHLLRRQLDPVLGQDSWIHPRHPVIPAAMQEPITPPLARATLV